MCVLLLWHTAVTHKPQTFPTPNSYFSVIQCCSWPPPDSQKTKMEQDWSRFALQQRFRKPDVFLLHISSVLLCCSCLGDIIARHWFLLSLSLCIFLYIGASIDNLYTICSLHLHSPSRFMTQMAMLFNCTLCLSYECVFWGAYLWPCVCVVSAAILLLIQNCTCHSFPIQCFQNTQNECDMSWYGDRKNKLIFLNLHVKLLFLDKLCFIRLFIIFFCVRYNPSDPY